MDTQTLLQITVSLALGLLLGLQRQRTEASIAGIRTFPFIALLGTVCAKIAEVYGGWIIAAGLLALAAVLVFANVVKMKAGNSDAGMTTELAVLLLYALGALIVVGPMPAAVVIGGVMMLLLHLKEPMHKFAAAVGEHDMRAIAYFVLISLIILPVLPNASYGPYGVWNPFSIWLMVVLIVAISLSGYVAYKLFGARAGALLGGIIGGLISSTATTVSFARRTAADAAMAPLAAFVIMTASCVSLVRVLVEISAVAPGSLAALAPPLSVMLGVCIVIAGVLYFLSHRQKTEMPEQKNPAELKAALIFGALYAIVLLAVAAARDHFGSAGLYVVAALSGLTDMDAITLSSAELADKGAVETPTAWRAILIAAMANFVFKFGTIAAIGSRALTGRIAVAFAAAVACGGAILWLWPW
jgi:uncharacterized membrane protein (DUF4010 family)